MTFGFCGLLGQRIHDIQPSTSAGASQPWAHGGAQAYEVFACANGALDDGDFARWALELDVAERVRHLTTLSAVPLLLILQLTCR
jgi:hypothetical protein